MKIKTECKECYNKFIKRVDSLRDRDPSNDICYACALDSMTEGRCPEEGDFNSAAIISGEVRESDEVQRMIMEDLRKVDWAACQEDDRDDDYDY